VHTHTEYLQVILFLCGVCLILTGFWLLTLIRLGELRKLFIEPSDVLKAINEFDKVLQRLQSLEGLTAEVIKGPFFDYSTATKVDGIGYLSVKVWFKRGLTPVLLTNDRIATKSPIDDTTYVFFIRATA